MGKYISKQKKNYDNLSRKQQLEIDIETLHKVNRYMPKTILRSRFNLQAEIDNIHFQLQQLNNEKIR